MPEKGFRLVTLPSKPLKRKLSLSTISFVFYTIASFFSALSLLRKERPDVIIGMGGYASFAPIIAGAMYGTPRLLHEQNSIPGLANRILAKFCPTLAVSYPDSKTHFNKEVGVFITGNPVRNELFQNTAKLDARKNLELGDRFTVLIFGGSRGAANINKAAVGMSDLINNLDIQVILITGENEFEWISNRLRGNNRFKVLAFCSEMGSLYSASDIVVSRAGATTIAEITSLGKPSILIPYPYATAQHQYENARMLEKNEAAVIIKDEELTAERIFNKIKQLQQNREELDHIANSVLDYGTPDAAESLAKVVLAENRMKP